MARHSLDRNERQLRHLKKTYNLNVKSTGYNVREILEYGHLKTVGPFVHSPHPGKCKSN